MKKHSVVVELNELAKKDLYDMLTKLESYARNLTKDGEMNAFWVHENDPFHYTAGDGITFEQYTVEEKTWDIIESEIEGMAEFVNNFNLTKGVVVVNGNAVPAHKHNGGPDALWSLTTLQNASSGTIRFYYEYEDRTYDPNAFIFDTESELIFAEEARTDPNGIYSFNTDLYHSWHPDSYDKRDALIYAFYLKNTITLEDVHTAIANINAKYS